MIKTAATLNARAEVVKILYSRTTRHGTRAHSSDFLFCSGKNAFLQTLFSVDLSIPRYFPSAFSDMLLKSSIMLFGVTLKLDYYAPNYARL